jgi:hypothetical protein
MWMKSSFMTYFLLCFRAFKLKHLSEYVQLETQFYSPTRTNQLQYANKLPAKLENENRVLPNFMSTDP